VAWIVSNTTACDGEGCDPKQDELFRMENTQASSGWIRLLSFVAVGLVNSSKATIVVLVTLLFPTLAIAAADRHPVGALPIQREVLLRAIEREKRTRSLELQVTGISVPHHLLASDLIARGFWAAAGNSYDRIILISPDHFNRSTRPFATTRRDFDTVFGIVKNDHTASSSLLEANELFEESNLFEKEHGITALLPFIKHFFSTATIVPIAISGASTRVDWERALTVMQALMGPRVLIVQSTDYSHYLPLAAAVQRDQETLNVISANDPGAIERLIQVTHMDSKASQYIQMRLQNSIFESHAVVIANRNSEFYGTAGLKTTSYIVTAYVRKQSAGSQLRFGDQQIFYFGGDTFFGRLLPKLLSNSTIKNAMVAEVHKLTGGAPLIVNMESVLLAEPPEGLPSNILVSHASLAVPILRSLNVRAASLANNHSSDLGLVGNSETVSILERSHIKPLLFKRIVDMGAFRIVALNFVASNHPDTSVATDKDLEDLCQMTARPPLVAFVHWGQEFNTAPGPAEYTVAERLQSCGVSAIIGSHSHRASSQIEALQGGEYQMTFSLGNLLFDQRGGHSSTALLELRVFQQGTYATRLVAGPNLFELGSSLMGQFKNSSPEKGISEHIK
jgi:AmmeMemoRadiSam system protein B